MAGPDTNTNAPPYPIWGFGPPSPEPDTKKLDALLASLNSSAERFQTLWFSFLGLTLYLAIAALATTHRDLLLNNPQTLPILNIKVELLPFYVIAPLLYLVFHFYLLMMLALLARTASEFDKQLRTTLPGEPERERYRAQVGNALFLQLLVGMKGERTGINALLMGLIALITIVLAPLATLVLMQMMFLPYHHLRITWWHRGVVVADLVLIVVMTYRCFFPRGLRKAPLVLGALSRKPRWATAVAFCVLLAVALAPLVNWLSLQQGRWAGEPGLSFKEWRWWAGKPPPLKEVRPDYAATANGVVFGLFPDRLKLANEIVVGQSRIAEIEKEIISRGGDYVPTRDFERRDLQAAVLSGTDLRGVSLSGAAMDGADLSFARLDGARLDPKKISDITVVPTQVQGASLHDAYLSGAALDAAMLQGANLDAAHLQDTKLDKAQLQGASLLRVQLQGAHLENASLQGANFGSAPFARILFEFLHDLFRQRFAAHLEGAYLGSAQFQGADLEYAELQGADLSDAQLQGSDLSHAALDGANITRSEMVESELLDASVFRTQVANAHIATVAVRSVRTDRDRSNRGILGRLIAGSDVAVQFDVDKLRADATEFVDEKVAVDIARRFARLDPDFQSADQDVADQNRWKDLETQRIRRDPTGAQHRVQVAIILGDLACASDSAPYVARGLINNGRLAALGDQLDGVRRRMNEGFKTLEKCPGVIGFTEQDWRKLEAIKPN